jgi:hypothetical protein
MKLVWINIHYRYHINPIHTSLYIPYWYGDMDQYHINIQFIHHCYTIISCYTNVEMNIHNWQLKWDPVKTWSRFESQGRVSPQGSCHSLGLDVLLPITRFMRQRKTTSNIENWEMTGPCKWCMYMIVYVYYIYILYIYMICICICTHTIVYNIYIYIYMYIIVYTIITHIYIHIYTHAYVPQAYMIIYV